MDPTLEHPSLMNVADTTNIPLNEPEHMYVAVEGLAGTMAANYVLKFSTPVPQEKVRAAVRALISALPRFRGIVERGPVRPHLRILPDNEIVDQLFEQAWQCEPQVDAADPASVERYHNRYLNESVSLERGLACSFRWIPHHSTPILFMAAHHLMFDGRSSLYALGLLMQRLNDDQPIAPVPLEPVPMLNATRPARWWQWPRAFVDELRIRGHEKALQKGLHLQTLNRNDQPFLSTYAIRHHRLPITSQALRDMARRLKMSVASVVAMVMADAFLSYAPNDPKALAVIRQAVDLRPYHLNREAMGPLLGNHVGTFLVCESGHKPLMARVASIKAQFQSGTDRYAKRQMGAGIWFGSLTSYLGPNLFGYASVKLQRQCKMPRISCYTTSLGNLNSLLNKPEFTVRLADFLACLPSLSLLHAYMELGEAVNVPLVWPRSEATSEQISDYLARLDRATHALVDAVAQLPAKEASSGDGGLGA
jgi:hypothetical protein